MEFYARSSSSACLLHCAGLIRKNTGGHRKSPPIFLIAPRISSREPRRGIASSLLGTVLLISGFCFWGPSSAHAQESDVSKLKETVQQLVAQVQSLQARVKELESAQAGKPAGAPAMPAAEPRQGAAAGAAPASPREENKSLVSQTETSGHKMEINNGPVMRIQGFSHTGFSATTLKGSTNGFFLGNFDLFITSRISEKFSMLSELNFEAGEDNNLGVDLERMLVTYNWNDHLRIGFGRFHTYIGYYNNAYHHGNWFETATERPFLFLFEDEGGILPVHNVGLTVTGSIPSGNLGLHYVAEIGNGRPARHPQNGTVQNAFDENNGKAVNFAAYVRPEWARGLQAGFSVYHDKLIPDVLPRIDEFITSAHVVYFTSRLEFLNEAVLISHHFDSTNQTLKMPGFYTQIGRQWGQWRPFFRFQYANANSRDPVIGDAGKLFGPSFGLRYNWSEWAALKFQYDRNMRKSLNDDSGLTALLSFTF